jgi:superoxide dismutase
MNLIAKIEHKHGSLKEFADDTGITLISLSNTLAGTSKVPECIDVLVKYGFITTHDDLPKPTVSKHRLTSKGKAIQEKIKQKFGTMGVFATKYHITHTDVWHVLYGSSRNKVCHAALIKEGFISSLEELPRIPKPRVIAGGLTIQGRIRKKHQSIMKFSKISGVPVYAISKVINGNSESEMGINALIEYGFITSKAHLKKILKEDKLRPKTVAKTIMQDWGSIDEFAKVNKVKRNSLYAVLRGYSKSKRCLEALIKHGYVTGYDDLREVTS